MMGALELSRTSPGTYANYLQQTSKSAASSLLYRWILCIANREKNIDSMPLPKSERNFVHLDLAKINISPFDDYNLLHLDDKVLLHKLLSAHKDSGFWPFGVVSASELPASMGEFDEDFLWIHKRRSGYGSHGNQVMTSQEAKKTATTLDETSLLQRMVDRPLLVEGRKFSLRIYVVLFANADSVERPDVYISREGLLKLASAPVGSADTVDMRVHMTNSGRESVMTQRSLDYLQDAFATNGWSYEEFWGKIIRAVRSTLGIYQAQIVEGSSSGPPIQLFKFGIPKILGFDFVVDSKRDVWLVEVNRFPGLEARDESDRGVKHRVLTDTWRLASTHAGLSDSEVRSVFGDLLFDESEATRTSLCLEKVIS